MARSRRLRRADLEAIRQEIEEERASLSLVDPVVQASRSSSFEIRSDPLPLGGVYILYRQKYAQVGWGNRRVSCGVMFSFRDQVVRFLRQEKSDCVDPCGPKARPSAEPFTYLGYVYLHSFKVSDSDS